MAYISTENAKQYRQSMDVFFSLMTTSDNSVTVTASNVYSTVNSKSNKIMGITQLADLVGDGFDLDGNHYCLNTTETDGVKYGYMSSELAKSDGSFDNPMTLTMTLKNSLYMSFPLEMIGKNMTINGTAYTIEQQMNLELPGSVTLIFTEAVAYNRAKINVLADAYMILGNKTNIISANVTLRADTSIHPTIQASEFEVKMNQLNFDESKFPYLDGAIVLFWAGYAGDYSALRIFKATDVTASDNQITIKGEDRVSELDITYSTGLVATNNTSLSDYCYINKSTSNSDLYSILYKLPGTKSDGPRKQTNSESGKFYLMKTEGDSQKTYNEDLLFFGGMFYVDAGIPFLHNIDQTRNTFNVDYCSTIERTYEKKIATIEYAYKEYAQSSTKNELICEYTKPANSYYEKLFTFDQLMPGTLNLTSTFNGKTISYPISIIGSAGSNYIDVYNHMILDTYPLYVKFYGRYCNINEKSASITNGTGQSTTLSCNSNATPPRTAETVKNIVDQINAYNPEKLQFTWHGNPHIQPRDYLTLPTGEKVDVEEISMEFNGGGISSNVVGRLVV